MLHLLASPKSHQLISQLRLDLFRLDKLDLKSNSHARPLCPMVQLKHFEKSNYVCLIICRSHIQWLPSNKKILFFYSMGEYLHSKTQCRNLSETVISSIFCSGLPVIRRHFYFFFCPLFFYVGNKGEVECAQEWHVDCVQVKRFIQNEQWSVFNKIWSSVGRCSCPGQVATLTCTWSWMTDPMPLAPKQF